MAEAFPRTPVPGATFARLLARLSGVPARPGGAPLTARLGQWIDWTRAVALSRALDGRLPAVADDVPVFDTAEEAECARLRAALGQAVVTDAELELALRRAGVLDAPVEAEAWARVDFDLFRKRCLAHQRAMLGTTGHLRGRLRDMLSRGPAPMARLAEVDAVMELALSGREHALLSTVPDLLERHFERLRQSLPAGAWLDVFRRDMQGVLLAELDVRFQPIEGLLAALRSR